MVTKKTAKTAKKAKKTTSVKKRATKKCSSAKPSAPAKSACVQTKVVNADSEASKVWKVNFRSGYAGGVMACEPQICFPKAVAVLVLRSASNAWAGYATNNNYMGGKYTAHSEDDMRYSIKGSDDDDVYDGMMFLCEATPRDLETFKMATSFGPDCAKIFDEWFKNLARDIREG